MSNTETRAETMSATLGARDLEALLAGVSTHAHKRDDLPTLNSVKIWATGGSIYAVATDRYRLIEGKRAGEGDIDPAVIRLSDIKRIITLIKGHETNLPIILPVTITRAGDLVSVSIAGDSLTLTAWECNYPPHDHLFQAAEGEGVAIPSITFNPAYFSDYAKITDYPKAGVRVQFYGENKPIRVELGENWRALLMPMKSA
jgi:DNA polymerase III sliding clamp (beta) subunit (PCNA family)